MTLKEKIGIVTGVGIFNSRCVGDISPVARLGISSLCMNDGPAGVRAIKNITGFPTGINTASTFSRRLMKARGEALGEEFRGKGIRMLLGPAMDIMRSPKAGRGWESFGPDPWLAGEAAYQTIVGIQSVGVMACAKHFLANNQEHWRYSLSADLDDRTLHEIYWYPFLRSVEANVSSVMCAYNRLNQTSSCHNQPLITSLLKEEGGFQGFVVSDWGATHDTTQENANAGLDMEQPGDWILIGGGVYGTNLETAVMDGSVSRARLDEMVARILTPYYKLNQDDGTFPPVNFDSQHPDGSGSLNLNVSVRSAAHTALAREIAAASAVLLKNIPSSTRGLPLGSPKTIAMIGQDAKMPTPDCPFNQCDDGTMVIGWGSGSYTLDYTVPPITAITSYVGENSNVTSSLTNDINNGTMTATGTDVAIVFANAMSGESTAVAGNFGDRNDLSLWWNGDALIDAVASVNPNTIVVIHSVGPVYMTWSTNPNITAIVYAGAPGEQTGPALVDILWGAVNPSGRLPFSIADQEDAYPAPIVYLSLNGFPTIDYTEKLLVDYRFMDARNITPRFEFGFGLSYTDFTYSKLDILTSSHGVTIRASIQNTGGIDGTEIPQLYLGFPPGAGEPPKVLRGFHELFLHAGQRRIVTFKLSERDLSIWDVPSQSWTRPPGVFSLYVGASLHDIRLRGTF